MRHLPIPITCTNQMWLISRFFLYGLIIGLVLGSIVLDELGRSTIFMGFAGALSGVVSGSGYLALARILDWLRC